jgi:serine/threonine protein kinase
MELMLGGSLTDVLGRSVDFKEAHIAYVARAVLSALAYMHRNHKMHRDIKSDNVLVRVGAAFPWIFVVLLTFDALAWPRRSTLRGKSRLRTSASQSL